MRQQLHFTVLSLLLIGGNCFGQEVDTVLNGNAVAMHLSERGVFCADRENTAAGYEWPKGSGNHLIFANTFWFGAETSLGGLHLAAERYGLDDERDLYNGIISDDGLATASFPPIHDEIYFVSQAEINNHIANVGSPGYIMPYGIENWPAHGDTTLGFAYNIAAFVDVNGNNVYEPELGDYPSIRGDHTAYMIMNDTQSLHTHSGGDPIGLEIHLMFYQYETDDFLDSTSFVNIRVINRSSRDYSKFIVGNWFDFDIGSASNDYIGSNVENDMIYAYNGEINDYGQGGQPGYIDNVPQVGAVSLNNNMAVAAYHSIGDGPYGDPSDADSYWNYLNGFWPSGAPICYGGDGGIYSSGVPYPYMFCGTGLDGVSDEPWTEPSVGTPPGDRRILLATEPVPLAAGESACFDFAIVATFNDGDTHLDTSPIIARGAEVKEFYNSLADNTCFTSLGIDEIEIIEAGTINIYPNPSTGSIQFDSNEQFNLTIYSMDGRMVYQANNVQGNKPIQTNLSAGTYITQLITQKGQQHTAKLIIE